MRTLIRTIALGALLLPVLLIPGCKECPECPPDRPAGPSPGGTERIIGTEYPVVCARELECAEADLPEHFVTASLKPSDLLDRVHFIQLVELDRILSGIDRSITGLKVHFGAEAGNGSVRLRYGVELVEIDRRKDSIFYDVEPIDGMVFQVASNGTLTSPVDTVAWNRGPRDVYMRNIKVFRTNDSIPDSYPDKLRWDYDCSAYIFRMADVDSLINDNSGCDRIKIRSIATPNVRRSDGLEDDWFHHVALVAATGSMEYLNDDARTIEDRFRNKALDLGSPCPPSCVLARFYRYGMAPRTNCQCY